MSSLPARCTSRRRFIRPSPSWRVSRERWYCKAILGTDGTVQDLKVLSGHPLLVRAALDAVKTWRYQPTLLNSEPVDVLTEIDVNFNLEE